MAFTATTPSDAAADNILPLLGRLHFERVNKQGLAVQGLGLAMLIAFPFLFAPNLDVIATVVTSMYAAPSPHTSLPAPDACLSPARSGVPVKLRDGEHDVFVDERPETTLVAAQIPLLPRQGYRSGGCGPRSHPHV